MAFFLLFCGIAVVFMAVPIGLVFAIQWAGVPDGESGRIMKPGVAALVLLVLAGIAFFVGTLMHKGAEGSWRTLQGTVTGVRAGLSGTMSDSVRHPEWTITYDYVVNDIKYTNHHTIRREYFEGDSITVYYDENDHARSRLTDPESSSEIADIFQIASGVLLVVSMLPGFLLAYRLNAYRRVRTAPA